MGMTVSLSRCCVTLDSHVRYIAENASIEFSFDRNRTSARKYSVAGRVHNRGTAWTLGAMTPDGKVGGCKLWKVYSA